MKKLKAIIIEDNPGARDTLIRYLEDFSNRLTVVGTAANEKDGYNLIVHQAPDLVFLDIALEYNGSGFNILDRLKRENTISSNFKLIFTTGANDAQTILKAFKYAAVHYLPKPVNRNDLKEAIERILQEPDFLTSEQIKILIDTVQEIEDNTVQHQISFTTKGGNKRTEYIKDIVYLEANESMTIIYLENGDHFTAFENMGKYSSILTEDHHFFRIHHSYVIHLPFVQKILRSQKKVLLKGYDEPLPCSRRKWSDFLEYYDNKKRSFTTRGARNRIAEWLRQWLGR